MTTHAFPLHEDILRRFLDKVGMVPGAFVVALDDTGKGLGAGVLDENRHAHIRIRHNGGPVAGVRLATDRTAVIPVRPDWPHPVQRGNTLDLAWW